jgi:hypothetical protein
MRRRCVVTARTGINRTDWFSRIRPLTERGTLNGAALFGGLLRGRAAAL